MTTLKSINQSIEEGNDDLEELNDNFKKWFELQKRNRLDDLENRREMKRAIKAGVGGGTGAGTPAADEGSGIPWWAKLLGLGGIGAAAGVTLGSGKEVKKTTRLRKNQTNRPRTNTRLQRFNNKQIEVLEEKLKRLQIRNLNGQIKEATRINTEQLRAAQERMRINKLNSVVEQTRMRMLQQRHLLNRTPYGPGSGQMKFFSNQGVFPNEAGSKTSGKGTGNNPIKGNTFKPITAGGFDYSRPGLGGHTERFVKSSTGKFYNVNSAMGQKVITMSETYQKAQIQKGLKPTISTKVPPLNTGSPNTKRTGGGNKVINPITKTPVVQQGRSKVSFSQTLRSALMNTTSVTSNITNRGLNVLGLKAQGTRPPFTGKILTDIRNYNKWAAQQVPGKIMKFLGTIVKFALPIVGALMCWNFYTFCMDPNNSPDAKVGEFIKVFGTGLIGASLGAKIGAFLGTVVLPGFGTFVGSLVGAWIGYKYGYQAGAFIGRHFLKMKPDPNDGMQLQLALDNWAAGKQTSTANKMLRINASNQDELGLSGERGIVMDNTGGPIGNGHYGRYLTSVGKKVSNVSFNAATLESGMIPKVNPVNPNRPTSLVNPTAARQAQFDTINRNIRMGKAMSGYQTGGRDTAPIVVTDQSTNAGPTSMAITLVQGNGGIRTLDHNPRIGYESGQDLQNELGKMAKYF